MPVLAITKLTTTKLATIKLQWLLLVSVAAIVCAGCTQSARDLPLDQSMARQACETALKAWQEGKRPADLKPDIIVGDYGWESGQRLVSYEFLPQEEFNDGTNLHIRVGLTVQDAKGKESTSNVLYIVGTSPVITVIRD